MVGIVVSALESGRGGHGLSCLLAWISRGEHDTCFNGFDQLLVSIYT